MQATNGLCSHAKACLEASARGGNGGNHRKLGSAKVTTTGEPQRLSCQSRQRRRRGGDSEGSALTFFMPPHSWTTRLPCEETRAKSAGAPEPGWVTENRTDTPEAPTVNTIFRRVAGRPRETPEPATHASGPTPRNLLSPRRDRGTPPESLGGARKAWRHAPACAPMVQNRAAFPHSELAPRTAKKVDDHKAGQRGFHLPQRSSRSGHPVVKKLDAGRRGKSVSTAAEDEANGGGLCCREMTGSRIVELS